MKARFFGWLLATLIPVGLIMAPVFGGQSLPWSKLNHEFTQNMIYLGQVIEKQDLPHWNSARALGESRWLEPLAQPFHPIFLFFWKMPPKVAIFVLVFLATLMASLGTYRLCLSRTHHAGLSLMGALAYSLSGFFWQSMAAIPAFLALALLPWILHFYFEYQVRRRPWRLCGLSLGLTIALLLHQWLLAFAVIAIGSLAALSPKENPIRRVLLIFGLAWSGLAAWLLSAPVRAALARARLDGLASLPPEPLWSPQPQAAQLAMVLVAAGLAGLALRLRNQRQHFLASAFVLLAALIFYFGKAGVMEQLWQKSGGLIESTQIHAVYGIAYLILILLGLRALRQLQAWQGGHQGLMSVAAVAVVAELALFVGRWFSRDPRAINTMMVAVAFGLVAILALMVPERTRDRVWIWLALAMVVTLEGFWLKPTLDWRKLKEVTAVSLIERIPQPGRIFLLGFDKEHPLPMEFLPGPLERAGWSTFNPPSRVRDPRLASISDADFARKFSIYNRLIRVRYVLAPVDSPSPELQVLLQSNLIQRLSSPDPRVALYRTTESSPEMSTDRALMVLASAQEALGALFNRAENRTPLILERGRAFSQGRPLPAGETFFSDWLPRFSSQTSLVGQTPVTLTLKEQNSDRLILDVLSAAPSILVHRALLHPDWRAYSDGTETPIFQVDYLNRGVFLKSGQFQLELRYQPREFARTTWPMGIGVIMLIILLILEWRSPRQELWTLEEL